MKTTFLLHAAAVIMLSLSVGCVGVGRYPFVPPIGGTFTNVSTPLDIQPTEHIEIDASGDIAAHNILGLITWGSMSANEAAIRSRMDQVDYAEVRILRILGVYTRTKLHIFGPHVGTP